MRRNPCTTQRTTATPAVGHVLAAAADAVGDLGEQLTPADRRPGNTVDATPGEPERRISGPNGAFPAGRRRTGTTGTVLPVWAATRDHTAASRRPGGTGR